MDVSPMMGDQRRPRAALPLAPIAAAARCTVRLHSGFERELGDRRAAAATAPAQAASDAALQGGSRIGRFASMSAPPLPQARPPQHLIGSVGVWHFLEHS
jgi:hypothetical protein